jgi:5-methyltetrahydrofolate--homocysteine methyltransferase
MNHDPAGMDWIRFGKVLDAVQTGMSFADASTSVIAASGGRRGGRRGRG